ncbi:MAG: T9SS type A sorting domain-containing protein [Bacteroidales bacterium]|nr:T9SS type A sorting domain-containing protein [Bacteroidales bacterium]MCF8458931.1 T9SS type A sorting domain-containing protein [Bacteroidales bacterium]
MKGTAIFNNRKSKTVSLLAISFFLISWGSTGHYKISNSAALSFNQQMEQFQSWSAILADHASDADIRKATDPTEGPKHYIDIDNYSEFFSNGDIPQNLADAIAAHGETFVYDQGILPWATLTTFDSLVACFEREDWGQAVLFASDLGHYVADGFMPLHITRNYNGQFTGNDGIHSRYESTMINAYVSQITYAGLPIDVVPDVNQYVFDYLYSNYVYVDSVIAADDYAKSISSNTSSSSYKQALWSYSKDFTVMLFQGASHALAELIYTAWVQAGSPSMAQDIFSPAKDAFPVFLGQNQPNPFQKSTLIKYDLQDDSNFSLQIMDISGHLIQAVDHEYLATNSSYEFNANDLPNGIYYLVIRGRESCQVRKMLKVE